jgi:hypothetical protein
MTITITASLYRYRTAAHLDLSIGLAGERASLGASCDPHPIDVIARKWLRFEKTIGFASRDLEGPEFGAATLKPVKACAAAAASGPNPDIGHVERSVRDVPNNGLVINLKTANVALVTPTAIPNAREGGRPKPPP